jgi:hypothetical protein
MQGYLISKPLPPRQMAEMLRPIAVPVSPPLQPEAMASGEAGSRSGLKRAVV